jgi:hypothetical protein
LFSLFHAGEINCGPLAVVVLMIKKTEEAQ